MKFILKVVLITSVLIASASAQQLIPLSFNTIAKEIGSTTTFSSAGDTWRASDVSSDYAGQMDALFTIYATQGLTPSTVFFDDTNPARGDNMRVRVGPNVTNAQVFINIQLVNAGMSTTFTGWAAGDQLITQFSDIDSDAGADRTDFAGVSQFDYINDYSSNDADPGSSLLELDSTTIAGFDVFRLKTPWTSQGNVSSNDPVDQLPVTGGFVFDTTSSLSIVVGQFSNGAAANRHIDIDMTPDFTVIPEPSSFLLVGMAMLGLGFYRRRQ